MMDLHCHLDLYEDPAWVVAEAIRRNLYVLSVTTTPSAWRGTNALAPAGSRIKTALGLHPQLVHERSAEITLFETLFAEATYIGEVGLDGGPEYANSWDLQVAIFSRILALCAEHGGRVITIHSRRASGAVVDCIENAGNVGAPILHWFSGTRAELDRAKTIGCWFSVGPAMLRGARGRQLLATMPRDRILLESDGPFGRNGDQPLFPWDTSNCISVIAETWEMPERECTALLMQNLSRLVQQRG